MPPTKWGWPPFPRQDLAVLVNEHKKGAAEAAFMKDRMEASLAVIQLGITLFAAIAAAAGGVGAQAAVAPYLVKIWHISMTLAQVIAVTFIVIPLILATIIFAELVPKMFALNNKEWIVLRLSPAMKILAKIIDPLVSVIEFIVKKLVAAIARMQPETRDAQTPWIHELRAAVSLARTSKLMGEREEKIVLAAAHLSTPSGPRHYDSRSGYLHDLRRQHSFPGPCQGASRYAHAFPRLYGRKRPADNSKRYLNFKDIVSALRVNPSDPTIKGISRPITRV